MLEFDEAFFSNLVGQLAEFALLFLCVENYLSELRLHELVFRGDVRW